MTSVATVPVTHGRPSGARRLALLLSILLGLGTLLLGLVAIGFLIFATVTGGVGSEDMAMFTLTLVGSGSVLVILGLVHIVSGMLIRKGAKGGAILSLLASVFHGLLAIAGIGMGVYLLQLASRNDKPAGMAIGGGLAALFLLTGVLLLVLMGVVIKCLREPRPM